MPLHVFKDKFFKLCKEHNIDPPQAALEALKCPIQTLHSKNYVLTLSEKSLNYDVCRILSECLRHDNTFEEINFSDCMMPHDCFQLICEGLCDNSFVTKLNLKGNNIKNNGCEQLAKLVRENTSLMELSMEWNQVGLSSGGFEQFCSSLATNKSLVLLDMRNNQIGPDNATAIATAMRKNDVLRDLDLRYNSLGLSGAQELLKVFDKNRSLIRLHVLGNGVPNDLMRQIERLGERNGEVQKVNDAVQMGRHHQQQKSPHRQHHYQQQPVPRENDLVERLDLLQPASMRISEKRGLSKILQLEKLLNSKNEKCRELATKLNLAESKVDVMENTYKGLEANFHKSFQEREYLERQYTLQTEKEKEFRMDMEKRFLQEQSHMQEKILKLQNQISVLESELDREKKSTNKMKEKMASNNAEMRLKEIQCEEQISKLKDCHQREVSDIISGKEKELSRVRSDADAESASWRDRLSKTDEETRELAEEMAQLKKSHQAAKMDAERALHDLRQRMQLEQDRKVAEAREQLSTAAALKEELETQSQRQSRELESTHKELSRTKIDLEAARSRAQALEEELLGKQSQLLTEVEKVRLDWQGRVARLEAERNSQADLLTRIDDQDRALKDLRHKFREEEAAKDSELQLNRDELRQLKTEMARTAADSQRRAGALQTAVMQYCQPALASTSHDTTF